MKNTSGNEKPLLSMVDSKIQAIVHRAFFEHQSVSNAKSNGAKLQYVNIGAIV